MKKKVITFFVSALFYGVLSYLINYFVKSDYTNNQIINMSIFFGVAMGLFETLVRPLIFKTKTK
ncbi:MULTISPECIES: hypothetical protein [unclassified Olleya]|jgi:uncharacterized membrane protein YesL|uniref:hypothetical protein n=1 Tax=unclassified Olleya TaxID=2615019 RepID=UPI00119F4B72|nr:hypothetical protein [Olleya sp. Hel_I_94]TVZ48575.1 hypothetical protein JM82_3223 [Olleya sp. Hel_I_94]